MGRKQLVDNLSTVQRSYCMSRIKGRDTGLERLVRAELQRRGLRFKTYMKKLPGNPDIVFQEARLAVFVDGDFWHGYRFPQWKKKLSAFWREKIEKNRKRDQRNFAKLRRMNWRVVRVWKHTIQKDLDSAIRRITKSLA